MKDSETPNPSILHLSVYLSLFRDSYHDGCPRASSNRDTTSPVPS